MKRALLILFALIFTFSFTACNGQDSVAPSQPPESVEPSSEPSSEPSTEPSPGPSGQTTDPQITSGVSLTTGLPTDKEYKPVSVMIENHQDARPQTNLQLADIIYEVTVEGGATRFLCIFNDNYPMDVGPIRSTRIPFINIQREWDSPLIHIGGPESGVATVYGNAFKDIKLRIDFFYGRYNDYYWRIKTKAAPHNVHTNLKKLVDEKYNYTPDARTVDFTFENDTLYLAEDINTMTVPFVNNDDFLVWKYVADKGVYNRYMGGKIFDTITVVDGEDGKPVSTTAPLTVKNVIVQYVKEYVIPYGGSGRRNSEVVGSGKCDYFINGKHISGTWSRPTINDSTSYLLDDGTPLILAAGNTWICLQPKTKAIKMSNE